MKTLNELQEAYCNALSNKGRFYSAKFPALVALFMGSPLLGEYDDLTQRLHALKTKLVSRPKCYCGAFTKLQASAGFGQYCSSSCAIKDPSTIKQRVTARLNAGAAQKAAKTCVTRYGRDGIALLRQQGVIDKYGMLNVFAAPEIKDKIKHTMQEKYGVSHVGQVSFVKEKIKATNLKRFGTEYPSQAPEVKAKIKNTNLERYGHGSSWSNLDIKAKQVTSFVAQHNKKRPKIIAEIEQKTNMTYADGEWRGFHEKYNWHCNVCGENCSIFSYQRPHCRRCNPRSKPQMAVEDMVRSFGVEFSVNNRQIIKPLELDIVIPSKKLAIEVNGWYWHRDGFSIPLLKKTELAAEQGYEVLHFWDYEILEKPNIVKAIIQSKLGLNERVGARKLKIKELCAADYRPFLDKCHLQSAGAGKTLALVLGAKVLMVMQIAKPRFTKADFEIVRLASAPGITVVGGFSKLLKAFKITGTLVTYADRRISVGRSYANTGFLIHGKSEPNYNWHSNGIRLSRYATMKHKLPKLLGDQFNPALSERENMEHAGFARVSDCGNLIYKLKLNEQNGN